MFSQSVTTSLCTCQVRGRVGLRRGMLPDGTLSPRATQSLPTPWLTPPVSQDLLAHSADGESKAQREPVFPQLGFWLGHSQLWSLDESPRPWPHRGASDPRGWKSVRWLGTRASMGSRWRGEGRALGPGRGRLPMCVGASGPLGCPAVGPLRASCFGPRSWDGQVQVYA